MLTMCIILIQLKSQCSYYSHVLQEICSTIMIHTHHHSFGGLEKKELDECSKHQSSHEWYCPRAKFRRWRSGRIRRGAARGGRSKWTAKLREIRSCTVFGLTSWKYFTKSEPTELQWFLTRKVVEKGNAHLFLAGQSKDFTIVCLVAYTASD